MVDPDRDLEILLRAAVGGDGGAMTRLLDAIRPALLRFVARRLDSRVAVRLEPADVVQDVLVIAAARFGVFLEHRPLPFDPWLRQIALERVSCAHRAHIHSKKRSVCREARQAWRAESS